MNHRPGLVFCTTALAALSACSGTTASTGRGPASSEPAVIVIPEGKTATQGDLRGEVLRLCDLLPHRDEPLISAERREFDETLERLRSEPARARELIRAALKETPREQLERREFLASLERSLRDGTAAPERRTAAAANSRPTSR